MKKILVLLIACFLLCLAGCGEPKPVEIPLPEPVPGVDDVEELAGVQLNDPQLEENFRLVCNQIGIDPDQIQTMKKVEDWKEGPRYEFAYDDCVYVLKYNQDCTVESIYLGNSLKVFDKTEGAYHIDDYKPDSNIQVQIEDITQQVLKEAEVAPEGEELSITEWYIESEHNLYHSFGYVMVENSEGSLDRTYFSMTFENYIEGQQIHLRYFILGETERHNTMSEVVIPDRAPSVQQTAVE